LAFSIDFELHVIKLSHAMFEFKVLNHYVMSRMCINLLVTHMFIFCYNVHLLIYFFAFFYFTDFTVSASVSHMYFDKSIKITQENIQF